MDGETRGHESEDFQWAVFETLELAGCTGEPTHLLLEGQPRATLKKRVATVTPSTGFGAAMCRVYESEDYTIRGGFVIQLINDNNNYGGINIQAALRRTAPYHQCLEFHFNGANESRVALIALRDALNALNLEGAPLA